jgi:hypothetical protein
MRVSAIAVLALLAHPAAAQWSGWDYDLDRPKEKLTEIEIKLPPYPRDEDLVEFEVSAASADRFLVDEKALSIGADGVVRYTLVIKTGRGANNVSYEGMLCALQQTKMYATGGRNGTWMNARDPQWRPIRPPSVLDPRHVLRRDYLCAGVSSNVPAASVDDVLRRIRYGPREPMTN